MTVFTEKKTGTIFNYVGQTEDMKTIVANAETLEEKTYSESTLKRNFTKTEVDVADTQVDFAEDTTTEAPEEITVATTTIKTVKTFNDRAKHIAELAKTLGASVTEKESYIKVKVGKRNVAEIDNTKKGKVTLTVNECEFIASLWNQYAGGYVEELQDCVVEDMSKKLQDLIFNGKQAPEKYGWRMNYELNITEFDTDEIAELLTIAVKSREMFGDKIVTE